MNSCKRSAIWVCLTIAVLAAGPVWAQADGEAGAETRAARLEEAHGIVVEDLNRRSVRPVAAAVIKAEAERIVRRMSDEQVAALLEGEDLGKVLAKGTRGLATAQVVEGTEPADEPRLAVASAVGDAESHLLFVPLDPCRIIDTRKPGAGGMLTPGNVRSFHVAGTAGFDTQGGNAGGCGVPMGGATEPIAAAVAINLVAIQAQGSGHFLAWEFGQPVPLASVINYDKLAPFFNIANGTILPIAGISSVAKDLSVRADFNGAHLVADVTGYFTRFPVENFLGGLKSDLIYKDETDLIDMSDGACRELNSCVVTTTTPGTVIVEAWGQFVANHTINTLDRVAIGIETANPVVCNDSDTINASDFEVPASMGTNPDVDFTVSHGRTFSQPAGTTRTYRLSGQMLSGANPGDAIENSRMICTFIPD